MHHKVRVVALVCAGFSVAVWLANYLELTWLRPHACTLVRMQLESWLLFGRAAAFVLPVLGLLAGVVVVKPWTRTSAIALVSNALVIALTAIALSRHARDGWIHLPCLRE